MYPTWLINEALKWTNKHWQYYNIVKRKYATWKCEVSDKSLKFFTESSEQKKPKQNWHTYQILKDNFSLFQTKTSKRGNITNVLIPKLGGSIITKGPEVHLFVYNQKEHHYKSVIFIENIFILKLYIWKLYFSPFKLRWIHKTLNKMFSAKEALWSRSVGSVKYTNLLGKGILYNYIDNWWFKM